MRPRTTTRRLGGGNAGHQAGADRGLGRASHPLRVSRACYSVGRRRAVTVAIRECDARARSFAPPDQEACRLILASASQSLRVLTQTGSSLEIPRRLALGRRLGAPSLQACPDAD